MDDKKPHEGEPIRESLVLSFTVVGGVFTAKLEAGKGGVVQAGSVSSRKVIVDVAGTSEIEIRDGAVVDGQLHLKLIKKP